MFGDFGVSHLLVLIAIVALDVIALAQVWNDKTRSDLVKIVWTLAIVFLPLVGGLGWLFNWLLGRLTKRIEKRSA